MSNFFRKLVGGIVVEVRGDKVYVHGIPADAMMKSVTKLWTTSKIATYMFEDVKRNSFSFRSFFALDVVYIISRLLEDPAVRLNRRVLGKIKQEIIDNTWLGNINKPAIPPLDLKCLNEIKLTLLDHQQRFLEYYNNTKPKYGLSGMLLTAAAGGGKTISDISIAVCAKAEVVYIVSPKNAVYRVWDDTLKTQMTTPQRVWVAADGVPHTDEKTRWFIFHYESLDKAVEIAKKNRGKRCVVILDESHNFNDSLSLRTERFLELCRIAKPTDTIWASGTPIKALGYEAIPLIKCIDPLFTPEVEFRFKKIFGRDASRANDILNHRLGIVSFKVPKAKFMEGKPIHKRLDVKIPNGAKYSLDSIKQVMANFIVERNAYYAKHKEAYRDFYDECLNIHRGKLKSRSELEDFATYNKHVNMFITIGFDAKSMAEESKWCNKYEKNVITPNLPQNYRARFKDCKSAIKYLELKIRGECLGRILSKERDNCHQDMIPHINFADVIDNAEKKTLIFTSYVKVVDVTHARLLEEGYKPLRVYGETNNELPAIVNSFEKNEDLNPLIATYQSLSTAVPLVMANTLIMLNSPFRSHEQEQAISRCYRIGQDTQVYVYEVFLDTQGQPNISTRSNDILEWSRQQVNVIMGIKDDGFDIGLEDFDIDMSGYETYLDVSNIRPTHQVVSTAVVATKPSQRW